MSKSSELKMYSMKEIAEHVNSESLWLLIDNGVYDVTNFMTEHPGGPEVLLEQAGKDATDPFNDVGHSADAKELMKEYKIGELCEEDRKDSKKSCMKNCMCMVKYVVPVGIALVAIFIGYKLYTRK